MCVHTLGSWTWLLTLEADLDSRANQVTHLIHRTVDRQCQGLLSSALLEKLDIDGLQTWQSYQQLDCDGATRGFETMKGEAR